MGFIGEAIWEVILKVIWFVFIQGPLQLISVVQGVFEYLTTGIIYDVLFNGQKDFRIENIPQSFWAFCIIGGFVAVLIFTIQYMTYTFNEDLDWKTRIVKSLKSTGLAIVFVFFIPIGFYGLTFLIEFLQKAFQLAFGLKNANLADLLYKMGDPDWKGDFGNIPSDYSVPGNIKNYNIVVEILAVAFLLYTLIMLCMAIVQKSIELFLLFLIGPLVAAWMVNDHGIRMKQWKDMVIAKAFVSIGNILSYIVMINFLMLFISKSINKFEFSTKMFLLIVVILGVSTFALVAPQIIASFTGGEGVTHSEGQNALLSAKHGKGIFGAGMKALGWAAGGAGMMALFKSKGSNGATNALNRAADKVQNFSASDPDGSIAGGKQNLAAAQNISQKMKGFPSVIGRVARGATSGVAFAGGLFSRKGWASMRETSKNVVKGVATNFGVIAGANTINRFVVKRNKVNSTYSGLLKNTLKKNVEKIENSNFKKHENLVSNLKNSKNPLIAKKALELENKYAKQISKPTKKVNILEKRQNKFNFKLEKINSKLEKKSKINNE
ncbi:Mbov_0396 family ICE element transmembrane protein [Spiroplasma floricola]|uniref:Transmembrane protein n=1 Tax=Spiroplasma floricola 23-6 TaxID=1336749 RepID=A0A2K8SF00_9MOLU|nr:hypothetical protein [Spiroplasma floricola]AUB32003.1 hypothetical protein SFLOR_v1c09550 [Spiroplasma floricola 23-6]